MEGRDWGHFIRQSKLFVSQSEAGVVGFGERESLRVFGERRSWPRLEAVAIQEGSQRRGTLIAKDRVRVRPGGQSDPRELKPPLRLLGHTFHRFVTGPVGVHTEPQLPHVRGVQSPQRVLVETGGTVQTDHVLLTERPERKSIQHPFNNKCCRRSVGLCAP